MQAHSANRSDLLKPRVRVIFGCVLLGYTALAGRLVYLQGFQGRALRDRAIKARRGVIPLPARRGTILDRNGIPFARSLYTANLGFDPSLFAHPPTDPQKAAQKEKTLNDSIALLSTILHHPQSELRARIDQARLEYAQQEARWQLSPGGRVPKPSRFVLIQQKLPAQTVQAFNQQRQKLKGFGIQDDTRRAYMQGDSALQVVGYVDDDGKPVSGIERSCNPWLERHPGYVLAERDGRGRQIPGTQTEEKLPMNGLDMRLTLDVGVQQIAREELQRAFEKYHPRGAEAVVVDPATGDILAMVSLPTFDPNPDQPHPKDIKTIGAYQIDRCASQVYEPGSTLKTLAIAAALDKGVIHRNSYFHCGGSLRVRNRTIHDSHGEAHGDITPEDVLRHSCNVCAAQIGMRMGPTALYEAEKQFGLGAPMDLHLPHEQRGSMARLRPHDYTDAQAARVAFGQAITATPLHVAMAYAAIANNGTLMKPRLVASLKQGDRVIQTWEPTRMRQVVSRRTSEDVMQMLGVVVTNGTGRPAAVRGYKVAGKTGTSFKYKSGAYVGSFIGVIPATSTAKFRAVILVAIDEPKGAYYGAEVAAPVFHEIAARLMSLKGVPEDDPAWTQYKTAQYGLLHGGR